MQTLRWQACSFQNYQGLSKKTYFEYCQEKASKRLAFDNNAEGGLGFPRIYRPSVFYKVEYIQLSKAQALKLLKRSRGERLLLPLEDHMAPEKYTLYLPNTILV